MKNSLLLNVRHHLCPPLCIPLHLLCISLLPCRKKHDSFVVYPSQSGSELGVVSCFLCSPDGNSELSSLTPFPSSVCSSRKLGRVVTWQSVLSQLRMCARIQALSHQTGAACVKRQPLWRKQHDARVSQTFPGAERGGDQADIDVACCLVTPQH